MPLGSEMSKLPYTCETPKWYVVVADGVDVRDAALDGLPRDEVDDVVRQSTWLPGVSQ